MSPKERHIRNFIERSYAANDEDGCVELTVESIARSYYGSEWPFYWRQATIATVARVIKQMDGDRSCTITMQRTTDKRGRGNIAKYRIVEK